MRISTIGWLSVAALFIGCAATPPPELRDARAEYEQARNGPAAQLAPADLVRARQALAQAEQSFADNPSGAVTRDLAYAAKREAEVAESAARSAQEDRRRAAATAELAAAQQKLEHHAQSAEEEAATAQREAEQAERARLTAQQQADEAARQRQVAEAQAQQERTARQQTEAALQRLEQFATVRNEARGRVITLNGAVLFTTGTAELLPAARLRLDEVAQALKTERGAQFTVEGFTDSRGPAARNLELSEGRAEAVRSYLVNHGVPEERIRAIGRGEKQPVASNATPDGRANNRRVEIIISRRQAER